MRFAIPNKKVLENDSHVINTITKQIVCGQTNKQKFDTNEQYCKHFVQCDDFYRQYISRERVMKEIETELSIRK